MVPDFNIFKVFVQVQLSQSTSTDVGTDVSIIQKSENFL